MHVDLVNPRMCPIYGRGAVWCTFFLQRRLVLTSLRIPGSRRCFWAMLEIRLHIESYDSLAEKSSNCAPPTLMKRLLLLAVMWLEYLRTVTSTSDLRCRRWFPWFHYRLAVLLILR